jgi:beta-phosphoglucomutase-like phosphatase (HAD superfamily)
MTGSGNAFLFDLDGTFVDGVYQHVMAWRQAISAARLQLERICCSQV